LFFGKARVNQDDGLVNGAIFSPALRLLDQLAAVEIAINDILHRIEKVKQKETLIFG